MTRRCLEEIQMSVVDFVTTNNIAVDLELVAWVFTLTLKRR